MNRELPVYAIEGTAFIVDVANLQLREKENPNNVISLFDMRDAEDGYVFDYSPKEKNLPRPFSGDSDVRKVRIPELVRLDPVGMAEKYRLPLQRVQGRTDFELMVDQDAFGRRMFGHLPTVDILGHTFYVDIRMDMLRPKDNFLSNGIVFRKIDPYYNDEQERYIIPYNQERQQFEELDYKHITAIPENVIAISFPHESVLDPVGFNRRVGLGDTFRLKEAGLKSHFKAEKVDWRETRINEIVRENIKNQQNQKHSRLTDEIRAPGRRQRGGPKL